MKYHEPIMSSRWVVDTLRLLGDEADFIDHLLHPACLLCLLSCLSLPPFLPSFPFTSPILVYTRFFDTFDSFATNEIWMLLLLVVGIGGPLPLPRDNWKRSWRSFGWRGKVGTSCKFPRLQGGKRKERKKERKKSKKERGEKKKGKIKIKIKLRYFNFLVLRKPFFVFLYFFLFSSKF
ncbi:hypothetical protein L873DRAFT_1504260 [Choiromyces venosus 120613-1]|uniref:Uncharacterized protein n=1 Tax=Choiromyces venosus 120613-1 TaxID=1336337 RepID=A0A3N4J697_9PEZI|nr:hypothetical protein L873DRAFT_1504260 [Choiromyces venosus 120613-1]